MAMNTPETGQLFYPQQLTRPIVLPTGILTIASLAASQTYKGDAKWLAISSYREQDGNLPPSLGVTQNGARISENAIRRHAT